MKKIVFTLMLGAVLFTSCKQAPDAQKAQTDEAKNVQTATGTDFTVDPAASSVKWIGTKVTGQHNGTVAIKEGNLVVKEASIAGGSFVLDMNSITVDDIQGEKKEKLQGHLKSDDFFNTEKFPTAKFEISSVTADTTGGNTHKIEGNLTILDITKSISFGAKVNVSDATIEATTNFNINRKDWGVKYEGKKDDLIRDEINFDIKLVGNKKS